MLVTSRSTPLANLDQVIRLPEGIFIENFTKVAQESPNPPRLSCAPSAVQPWKSQWAFESATLELASMGPRPFSRGNSLAHAQTVITAVASMGPRPFSRGNIKRIDRAIAGLAPLQWGHGRSAVEIRRAVRENCGADMTLQWGHGRSAVEIRTTPLMVRHEDELQWGHGRSAVEMSCREGQGSEGAAPASMGPRPFSRGNRGTRRLTTTEKTSFNGATAVQPWKYTSPCSITVSATGLQWGHGRSAVEMTNLGAFIKLTT